jgi:hypothetical protein
MGFKVYSSYVVRDTYTNATEYFKHILTAGDIIDTRDFPATMKSHVTYSSVLYSLKSQYEIIEFDPHRYISMRRIEEMGFEIHDLIDYCEKVEEFVHSNSYFTTHSLRRNGFNHPLNDAGFGDWFYASILTEDKKCFSYQRMGQTKVFTQSTIPISMEDFLQYIVGQSGNIGISDLIETLEKDYCVFIERSKVIQVIDSSSMYYDRVQKQVHVKTPTIYDPFQDEVDKGFTASESLCDSDIQKIIQIFTTKFKSGYRISSNIDFLRLKDFYSAEYDDTVDIGNDKLDSFLVSNAVVFDDRAYFFGSDIVDSIREYLGQLDSLCVYIDAFFEKYADECFAFGIYSIDMLRAFINKNYVDICCKHEYIYMQPDITLAELVRRTFLEREAWTFAELFERMPWLKPDTVRQIFGSEECYCYDHGVYYYQDKMDNLFTDIPLEKVGGQSV